MSKMHTGNVLAAPFFQDNSLVLYRQLRSRSSNFGV